jgi:ethanolamine ammonia-lyase small subunit
MSDIIRDPWARLASLTPARIGLGRTGASLSTLEVLAFSLAHAQARDAVHARLDRAAVAAKLAGLGLATIDAESQAVDRQVYLRRPDLGARLSITSRTRLATVAGQPFDLSIVVADGLSATAVNSHSGPLLEAFLPLAARLRLSMAPIVIAEGARVALGDEIGGLLRAKLVVVVIGERPGLSAPDSLGVYITFEPRPGRHNGERNCISNVHGSGLSPQLTAAKLCWLVEAALNRHVTGVDLKDESGPALESRAELGLER